jgi:hypothetical protein
MLSAGGRQCSLLTSRGAAAQAPSPSVSLLRTNELNDLRALLTLSFSH